MLCVQPDAAHAREQNYYRHQIVTAQDFGEVRPSHSRLCLGVAHGSEQRWFRQGSALHRWFCFTMSGGLNMQIEHHLFPTVCHCHLRAIKPIVVRRRRPPPPPTALPNASTGFADASLREARGSVQPVARLQRCVPEALLPHGSHVRATSGGEAERGESAVSKNVGCTSMGETIILPQDSPSPPVEVKSAFSHVPSEEQQAGPPAEQS